MYECDQSSNQRLSGSATAYHMSLGLNVGQRLSLTVVVVVTWHASQIRLLDCLIDRLVRMLVSVDFAFSILKKNITVNYSQSYFHRSKNEYFIGARIREGQFFCQP